MLVCTDIASRGIDTSQVSHSFSYSIPSILPTHLFPFSCLAPSLSSSLLSLLWIPLTLCNSPPLLLFLHPSITPPLPLYLHHSSFLPFPPLPLPPFYHLFPPTITLPPSFSLHHSPHYSPSPLSPSPSITPPITLPPLYHPLPPSPPPITLPPLYHPLPPSPPHYSPSPLSPSPSITPPPLLSLPSITLSLHHPPPPPPLLSLPSITFSPPPSSITLPPSFPLLSLPGSHLSITLFLPLSSFLYHSPSFHHPPPPLLSLHSITPSLPPGQPHRPI